MKIILSRFRIIYHTIIFFKQVFKSTKSKLLQELLKLLKISSSKQTFRTKNLSMHLKLTIDIVGSEITTDATFVDNNICKPLQQIKRANIAQSDQNLLLKIIIFVFTKKASSSCFLCCVTCALNEQG